MKFGVLGCRHMHVSNGIDQLLAEGHHFVGIVEAEGPYSSALAKKHNVAILHSAEQLFSFQPDIVLSSAINSEKIDITELCIARDVSVMLDKPAVTTEKEFARFERLFVQCQRKRSAQIGLMLTERFNPAYIAAKKVMDTGKLGTILSISFNMPHKLSPQNRESWFFCKEKQGGIIIDLTVHDYDLLRWLTGCEIVHTSGYVKKGLVEGHPDFYHDCHLLTQLENGVVSYISAGWWTPAMQGNYGDGRVLITGTNGTAEIYATGNPALHKKPFVVLTTNEERPHEIACEPATINLMQDFLHKIEGKAHQITDEDILAASYATLMADKKAHCIVQPV